MQKTLGLFMLSFYAVGMILGAGVYSIVGKGAGVAQQGLWFSFVLASIAALLTALSYAELSALYPEAGAEYVFLKKVLPQYPVFSFLCGSLMIFALISTSSSVSLAFAAYLQQFLGSPLIVVSIGILLLFTLVNIWGIRESAWMNIVFTAIEVLGLCVFIYYGFRNPNFGDALSVPLTWKVLPGATLIFFAYLGFESMANLAEESKDPEKNIPRAIIISLFVTTILYVLVSLSALAMMTPELLSQSNAVLSSALQEQSPSAARMLGAIALFATGNTVMIALLAASRVTLGMARGKALPQMFALISLKRKTPWLASIVVFIASLAFLPLKRIEIIASVSSFTTLIVFFIVNAAVIYLRIKQPDLKRPFQVPWVIAGWPVLPTLAAVVALFFLFHFEQKVYLVGLGIVLMILLVFMALHRGRA